MTKDEALDLALEALEYRALGVTSGGKDLDDRAITAIKQARALDKKAENARELGLDYEPHKGLSEHMAQATNGRVRIDPVTGDVGIGTPPAQLAPVQEPVAWPAGLIDRIKAAEQRIQDGHALRRIPADPTDVDLVLAEVRYLLEGKQPPFWIDTTPPAAQRQWIGLTNEEVYPLANEHLHYQIEGYEVSGIYDLARAIEAKLKEKNNG